MFASFPSYRCLAIGTALMAAATGAWAVSAAEVSALSGASQARVQQISARMAEIKKAMPALSDEQARNMASAVLANPALLSALQFLDNNGSATNLFAHFATLLQGVELTPEHFDAFLARILSAPTLTALGIADIRELTMTTPSSRIARQADFDEAYYLAQNPDVAAAVSAGNIFSSGWAHYDLYGRLEGRSARALGSQDTMTAAAPSREALAGILKDLDELTEDLKIEQEDDSSDYRSAKARIDAQDGLKDRASTPSELYRQVQELKASLAAAATDAERKKIADAVAALQARTQIWTANLGSQWAPGTGAEYLVQIRDNLRAINDRISSGIQDALRSRPVTCTTAYDTTLHMVVTRCN